MSYGMTTFLAEKVLNGVFRSTAYVLGTDHRLGLLSTLASDDNGASIVEVSYTGYTNYGLGAPADADWSAPTGTPRTIDNAAEISFGTKTDAGTVRILGFAIWFETAKTNVMWTQALADNWRGFSVNEANETFTSHGHGLSVDDRVFLRGLSGATGADQQTEYFVLTAPDADTFTLSTTSGGSTLPISADGYGEIGDSQAKDVTQNDEVKFLVNTLKLQLD